MAPSGLLCTLVIVLVVYGKSVAEQQDGGVSLSRWFESLDWCLDSPICHSNQLTILVAQGCGGVGFDGCCRLLQSDHHNFSDIEVLELMCQEQCSMNCEEFVMAGDEEDEDQQQESTPDKPSHGMGTIGLVFLVVVIAIGLILMILVCLTDPFKRRSKLDFLSQHQQPQHDPSQGVINYSVVIADQEA